MPKYLYKMSDTTLELRSTGAGFGVLAPTSFICVAPYQLEGGYGTPSY